MRTVLIQDASVLIDLAESGLLESWFGLGLDLRTTSLVWREITRRNQKTGLKRFVEEERFRIEPVGAERLAEVVRKKDDLSARVTLEDASVLVFAKALGAVLLTGDRRLRQHAEEEGVETHGMLWVFDTLVARGALLPGVAADRLETLRSGGSCRLPGDECDARIRKWRR